MPRFCYFSSIFCVELLFSATFWIPLRINSMFRFTASGSASSCSCLSWILVYMVRKFARSASTFSERHKFLNPNLLVVSRVISSRLRSASASAYIPNLRIARFNSSQPLSQVFSFPFRIYCTFFRSSAILGGNTSVLAHALTAASSSVYVKSFNCMNHSSIASLEGRSEYLG